MLLVADWASVLPVELESVHLLLELGREEALQLVVELLALFFVQLCGVETVGLREDLQHNLQLYV